MLKSGSKVRPFIDLIAEVGLDESNLVIDLASKKDLEEEHLEEGHLEERQLEVGHLEEEHLEKKCVFLHPLPEPVSKLNWQQAQLVLSNLLTAANHGNPPDYVNPNAKPPFWPGCQKKHLKISL
jgi:hypothetical protein